MRYTLILLLVFTFTAGCKQRPGTKAVYHTEELLYEEFYANGQLKLSKQFLDESQADYLYLAYYEDGRLMDSLLYKNNQPHGLRIYFDHGSGLTHVEHYDNGVLEGINMGIYGNGVKNYEGFRKAGSKAGEWIFRNPVGNTLTYEFYDSTGKLLYFRKYDERGKYQKSNGGVLIDVAQEDQMFSVGEHQKAIIVAVIPPGCESILTISQSSDIPEEHTLYKGALTTPRSTIPIPVDEPGEHLLKFNLKVIDTVSGRIEKAQTEIIFTVKSN